MCVSKAIYIGPVVHVHKKKKKIDVCGVHKINTFTQKKKKKEKENDHLSVGTRIEL